MSEVQVEQKTYQMPPQDGITIAHFLTVADVERSLRDYARLSILPDTEIVNRSAAGFGSRTTINLTRTQA
jgi:hypothetical protein